MNWNQTRRSVRQGGRLGPALVAALTLLATLAQAQETKDLPKAEAVIDRYVEVTGGKAAYEKFRSRVSTGTLELPSAGIKGKLTVYQVDPHFSYTQVDIEGIGKSEEGSDGTIAWETSSMTGPRLKDGTEKATTLRMAAFNGELHWRKHYPKVENTGLTDVNGKPAYKIVLTPAEGKPVTQYYDKESGLIVKSEMVVETQMGEIPVETFAEEYKEIDGVKFPMLARQKMMMQEQLIRIEKIEHNVDIPKDKFNPPDDIKKLLEKAASKPAEEKKP